LEVLVSVGLSEGTIAKLSDSVTVGFQVRQLCVGTAAGLDGEAVRAALEQGLYRERVIQDKRDAADLGITAVPTVMVGQDDRPLEEGEVMSGAQPYEVVKAAVERAKPSMGVKDSMQDAGLLQIYDPWAVTYSRAPRRNAFIRHQLLVLSPTLSS
jgi:hypothetical protein